MSLHSPPLFTADGLVERRSFGKISENHGITSLPFRLRVPLQSDQEEGLLRDLNRLKGSAADHIRVTIRSGYAQLGLDLQRQPGSDIEIKNRTVCVPVTIHSLRGAAHDHILDLFRKTARKKEEKIQPGGLLLIPPDSALERDEVEDLVHRSPHLRLPQGSTIQEDGSVLMPLAEKYDLATENLTDEVLRKILLHSKHGISRYRAPRPLPKHFPGHSFLLGNVHGLSLGSVTGILNRTTNVGGITHNSAFGIHGVRSTGAPRQLELFNANDAAVPLDTLRVSIRFYPPDPATEKIGSRVMNARTIESGVDLCDLLPPERFASLINEVSPIRDLENDRRPYGVLLGRGSAAKIPWASRAEFQAEQSAQRAQRFVEARAADQGEWWVTGQGIPDSAREVTELIGYVGAGQNHNKMSVTDGFPSPDVMNAFHNEGIGVFVARRLRTHSDAYAAPTNFLATQNGTDDPAAKRRPSGLFFDSNLYEQFRHFERRGAKLFLVVDPLEDEETGELIKGHVREFWRGMWVRPDAKERCEKVNMIVAMYGAHAEGIKEALRRQLHTFLRDLREKHGEAVGITHGKGPGLMRGADDAAAEHDIPRFGIGICIEGQSGNWKPEALVDFHHSDRLTRQNLMDNLATIKVFNIGGAGTLEEAAITICSQKLGKKALTPIIFVDPFGLGENGEHLYAQLQRQILTLTEQKRITLDQATMLIQLLQPSAASTIHCVRSYEEANAIIANFTDDPMAYYRARGIPEKEVLIALQHEEETLRPTGFDSPYFIQRLRTQQESMILSA